MNMDLEKILGVFQDENGQSLAEYGLLIALVAVICIAALIFLGDQLVAKFKDVGNEIKDAKPH